MAKALAQVLGQVLALVLGLVGLFTLWYLWCLFPILVQAPGSGALFHKPNPTITMPVTDLGRDPSGQNATVPTATIDTACKPTFFLKPLEGRASHVTVRVTNGSHVAEAEISCSTGVASPWRTLS